MDKGVNFLEEYRGISIYADPYMDKNDSILMGKKGKEVDPGIVYVPTKKWEDGLRTMKPASIEKSEIDAQLKEVAKNRKFLDYTFMVCHTESDIEKLKKFIDNKLDLEIPILPVVKRFLDKLPPGTRLI
jgi:hypothetical protein